MTRIAPHIGKGFTLIELLLYVSLTAILLLSITAFIGALLSARVKNASIAEVDQQGAQVMQQITQAVRNSEAIVAP
jgi:type II secretory pathway component PulJ